MSQPRLHDSMLRLFGERDDTRLNECLNHIAFENFLKKHDLSLTLPQLAEVFTHTSFAHEYNVPHQEQLEFLGDSVLQLILTHELVLRFPQDNEGQLSKMRSRLVNEQSLANIASSLDLSELLLVGKGEFKKDLHLQESVLADTMEALLGQIYTYLGFDVAHKRFIHWLEASTQDVWKRETLEDYDPKSKLQEKSLAKFKKLPAYSAEPEGEKFLVKLWLNDELAASGVFNSKKSGEKELASSVLKKNII